MAQAQGAGGGSEIGVGRHTMTRVVAFMRQLVDKGLSWEDAATFGEHFEASIEAAVSEVLAAAVPARSPAAIRQAAYRERKRNENITRDVTRDVTPLPPETKSPPTPPIKTQTPNPSKNPPKGGQKGSNEGFDRFWSAYPRKTAKADALRAYNRALRRPGVSESLLVGGLERAKAAWTDPEFIPHAATWLNGARWEDEPVQPKPAAPVSEFAKWMARKSA